PEFSLPPLPCPKLQEHRSIVPGLYGQGFPTVEEVNLLPHYTHPAQYLFPPYWKIGSENSCSLKNSKEAGRRHLLPFQSVRWKNGHLQLSRESVSEKAPSLRKWAHIDPGWRQRF